jgi:kynureninase
MALSALFIERVEATCAGLGVTLATPRLPAERGSQVSFAHADGYPVMQALIEQGVVGDFRAGQGESGDAHLLRFGFTPLYTRFVDAWDAAAVLAQVLTRETWREPRFAERSAVT